MEIYKCRKCGAPLMPQEDQITAVCENCGNLLRLPRVDQKLYNRANELRLSKKFDQAAAMFRECLTQDPQDAECHWNLLLCKFGVEYVEDKDGSLIPTCNGITYDSILEDEDYVDAVRFADEISARLYEAEAKRLYVIQQEIIKLAQKGEEFDVFISYKETDKDGGRTEDSVLAQTVYDELTKKGYKVFFSRVTLKGEAGLKYEPIIFSALNSAPVMLLIGTSSENMESVWVKNEWTRFLNLMEEDTDKKIEVVYKGMERIELPARLRFVAQRKISENDKYGWYQDVAYDVDSMLEFRKEKQVQSGGFIRETDEEANDRMIKNLYIRYEQLMEDKKEDQAKECLIQALDVDYNRTETWWRLLNHETDNRTYFLKKQAEPNEEIANYVKQVIVLANDSEKAWKEATEEYITEWHHRYGGDQYLQMLLVLRSASNYSQENQKKIYQYSEQVRKYASPEDKEGEEKLLKSWEEKLPIWREYQEKTVDAKKLHAQLLNENKEYTELKDKLYKINQNFKKKAKTPKIFSIYNVLMILYLLIGPAFAASWKAAEATDAPWFGWIPFGSVVCLVFYALGLVIIYMFGKGVDSRKNDAMTEASIPLMGIVLGTIISSMFKRLLMYKAGSFFGVMVEQNKWGSITTDSFIGVYTAAQPFMIKFRNFLIILAIVHVVLILWTNMQKRAMKIAEAKSMMALNEYLKKTETVVDQFHDYYRKELGEGNLKQDKLTKDIKASITYNIFI